MHLSFLIPTLDEEAWIAHSVRAIRASCASLGCGLFVLVSDASEGEQTRVSALRAGADLVLKCPTRGRASQLQHGLDALPAHTDAVVLFHADSLVSPDLIAELCLALTYGYEAGWAQVSLLPERATWASRTCSPLIAWGINLRTRLFTTATADQAIWATPSLLEEVGGIPQIALMEGVVLARALRAHTTPSILGAHLRISARRWERGGIVRTTLKMYALRAAFLAGVPSSLLARVW